MLEKLQSHPGVFPDHRVILQNQAHFLEVRLPEVLTAQVLYKEVVAVIAIIDPYREVVIHEATLLPIREVIIQGIMVLIKEAMAAEVAPACKGIIAPPDLPNQVCEVRTQPLAVGLRMVIVLAAEVVVVIIADHPIKVDPEFLEVVVATQIVEVVLQTGTLIGEIMVGVNKV